MYGPVHTNFACVAYFSNPYTCKYKKYAVYSLVWKNHGKRETFFFVFMSFSSQHLLFGELSNRKWESLVVETLVYRTLNALRLSERKRLIVLISRGKLSESFLFSHITSSFSLISSSHFYNISTSLSHVFSLSLSLSLSFVYVYIFIFIKYIYIYLSRMFPSSALVFSNRCDLRWFK